MPYQMNWLVDKRVLYTVFSGVITQPELEQFVAEMQSGAQSGVHPVHHISNSLAMERVAFSLQTLNTLAKSTKIGKEMGWNLDINRNALLKMFATVGSQVARSRSRTFNTYEEAVAFLKMMDETLSDVSWNAIAPTVSTPIAPEQQQNNHE